VGSPVMHLAAFQAFFSEAAGAPKIVSLVTFLMKPYPQFFTCPKLS